MYLYIYIYNKHVYIYIHTHTYIYISLSLYIYMHLCIHGDMRDIDVDVNNYKYQTCPKKCTYKILQDQITVCIYIYIDSIYMCVSTLCLWHCEGDWPWLTGRCVELSADELKDSKKPGFLAGRWWFSPVSWLDRSALNMLGMSIHIICICMYHKRIILVDANLYIYICIDIYLIRLMFWGHVFGAGHLGGSRLLSHFVSYYQHDRGVGWVGGWVGWAKNVHLHSHTYVMPRYCTSSCTCTHTLAALRYVLLHLHTYVMPCTWLTVAGTSSTVGCHAAPQPCKSQVEPSLVWIRVELGMKIFPPFAEHGYRCCFAWI